MKQSEKPINTYVLGLGETLVRSGALGVPKDKCEDCLEHTPFIDLALLKEQKEVGEDLSGKDCESGLTTRIVFTSIEGLEVFEKVLKNCRKLFEEKQS
jgi:hypothetical protein